jgi:2-phospho-L-lactate transferase/gluconeogenesis factor (CofD/UPF0052 family)
MVKTKDEIMEEIRAYIGDRADDQTIALVENISDTIDDYAAHGDYDEKLMAVEAEWRRRYIDRFMNGGENKNEVEVEKTEDDEKEKAEEIKIEDLYTEKESD